MKTNQEQAYLIGQRCSGSSLQLPGVDSLLGGVDLNLGRTKSGGGNEFKLRVAEEKGN
jgi:hypothetical protein